MNDSMYTNGLYLKNSGSWHTEDSPWKASQILRLIKKNGLIPKSIVEVGCGAGGVLLGLSKESALKEVSFLGYDISPQAIALAREKMSSEVQFVVGNIFEDEDEPNYDILLAIDVFEHVPDYIGFLENCKKLADYKIFHIPLDLHVSSVLRNAFIKKNNSLGHLHFFTADSAIETLRYAGYEIVDTCYTNAALDLFFSHPSFRKFLANIPRWLFSHINLPLTARVLGGYSLLVLSK